MKGDKKKWHIGHVLPLSPLCGCPGTAEWDGTASSVSWQCVAFTMLIGSRANNNTHAIMTLCFRSLLIINRLQR